MAKILLIDFSAEEIKQLQAEKWDVEGVETSWKSGRIQSLVPPLDCRLVFYQLNLGDSGSGLHVGDSPNFEAILLDGGVIVCFLGAGEQFHLTNLFGPIPGLKLEVNKRPAFIHNISDSPIGRLLEDFSSQIMKSYEIFENEDEKTSFLSIPEGESTYHQIEILARNYRRRPVAACLRKGRGYLFLLPWFGQNNIEVVRAMLRQTLPPLVPHVFEENPFAWIESPEYYFPSLKSVFQQIQEEIERHRETIFRLRNQAEELKRTEQEMFFQLLTGQNERLKKALLHAFNYLEWPLVVDVDEYWKRVIRIKEEDIWLIDNAEGKTVEEKLRTSPIILVIIRSGLASAPESDLISLQKFKARRMQEFDNTKMKALLVGNYYFRQDARARPNPFTQEQIEEAIADGNGLITTAELFWAIKAEKEGKISKEAIKETIRQKKGLINFNY
ncbi:MAG: hypothetical protein N3B16_09310 [Candidatus Aminicenantes bacterium]|nr:hypothetical protein [Candidatus Aminicenantes bacterium]